MPRTSAEVTKEIELYKGEVIVQKREGHWGPEYWVSDAARNKESSPVFERKTGVTTFLGIKDKSRPLIIWAVGLAKDYLLQRAPDGITAEDVIKACRLHSEEKERTANIGTKVHDWISEYVKRKNPAMPEDPAVIKGVTSFLEWKESRKVKFVSSEQIVYSRKYDYCGSLDFEAEVDSKLYLGDFKTGNALYNEVLPQTAAYAMARTEESGIEYEGRYLLRLAKETEDEYTERVKDKNKSYVEPYKVFEAVVVKEQMKEDFRAFLAFQLGYNWNKESEKRLKLLKAN